MNTTKTATKPILVRDGSSDFNYYLSQFNSFAYAVNEFGKKIETELPDLKIKFGKELWISFAKGQGKYTLSNKLDGFIETIPHSLREQSLEWNWSRINSILDGWNILYKKFDSFKTPIGKGYPTEATDSENLPFDEDGKMVMSEEFKNFIRPLFSTYADGEKAHEALELMNQICDVFNKISDRIRDGKSHPNLLQINLSNSKPFFIDIDENGKYIPHFNYLNSI